MSTTTSPYWRLYGNVYDLTSFAKDHPGGAWIIQSTRGMDVTSLFATSHGWSKTHLPPLERLKAYKLGDEEVHVLPSKDLPPTETRVSFQIDGFYERLRRFVHSELNMKREIRIAERRMSLAIVANTLLHVVCLWGVLCDPQHLLQWTIAGGLSSFWFGTYALHSGGHQQARSPTENKLWLLLAGVTTGADPRAWWEQHILGHHNITHDLDDDPDLRDNTPLLRLHPKQPWYPYHIFQPVYAWIVYCFIIIGIIAKDLYMQCGGRMLSGRGMSSRYPLSWRWLSFISTKAQFVLMGGCWWNDIAIWPFVGMWLISGFCLSCSTLMNHFILETCEVDIQQGDKLDWGILQVMHSHDWTSFGWPIDAFNGYLNHQVAHHLFPTIPHPLLTKLTPIVYDFCAQNRVRVLKSNGFLTACWRHFTLLRTLAFPTRTTVGVKTE